MRILLTGADGFLGRHARARLRAQGEHHVIAVDRRAWSRLPELLSGVDAVIHLAGVNRGAADAVEQGNVNLARDLAAASRAVAGRPTMVFANSIQAGTDSAYGSGKSAAAAVLADASRRVGAPFVDVRLPNIFGEYGRPDYNSFVATFARRVVDGQPVQVHDRPVELLHAQAAAQVLIDAVTASASTALTPRGTPTSVQTVLDKLIYFDDVYVDADVPPLLTDFDVDLFNTLRSARFPQHYPMRLGPRTDARGSLTEVVRCHGVGGQTFISTTHPGITRGEHFHLRKFERFVVLDGDARISLRRLFTDDVVDFWVSGGTPTAVDMPTMWVHNITNTGSSVLTTLFWTNELFDPAAPDTYPETVRRETQDSGAI